MPSDLLVYVVVGSIVLAIAAWAGWSVGGWRRGRPAERQAVVPAHVWLCEGCHSFNDPTHETCYRCHRPRATDARMVEPDPEFHLDQQLGRSKTSVSWGASSPWLAADDPLRDAWLAERARAADAAPAGPETGPGDEADGGTGSAFGSPPFIDAAPEPSTDAKPDPDLTPRVDEPS